MFKIIFMRSFALAHLIKLTLNQTAEEAFLCWSAVWFRLKNVICKGY